MATEHAVRVLTDQAEKNLARLFPEGLGISDEEREQAMVNAIWELDEVVSRARVRESIAMRALSEAAHEAYAARPANMADFVAIPRALVWRACYLIQSGRVA